jgi:AraC family transcriptional activator of pobA
MSTTIPNYSLYGDEAQPAWLDMVHFERIHERSSLYQFDIAPHFHDGLIQLLYVTSGGGEVFIDGAKWRIEPPTLIVIPARHVHGFHFTPDIDGPVVTAAQRPLESLAGMAAPDLLPQLRRPLVLGVSGSLRYVDALMPLFDAIEREMRMHSSGEVAAGTALLMALFVQIARITTALQVQDGADAAGRTRKAGQVERFRALVDARFRERLPIESYAAEMGLSAGQLSRLCRDMLGMSGLDVVNARVVHEAERELVYSTLGFMQIAALLGFGDEAYFGRFFKKQTGRTPTEFRDAARRRLAPDRRAAQGDAGAAADPTIDAQADRCAG